MTPEDAYDHICEIAKEHALILNAFGGVVTIVHPDTQRQESLYDHIQYVHGLGAHPDTLERERAEVSNVKVRGCAPGESENE